ncbi:heat shock transcription factor, Y-linked-like [Egretta garzetta]|uniref:heat shock transcription factor, Y-linked-like n=1 Tax=Egretta garzetta TaxID=188379 RepID=UPI00163C620C|nr:heat shock transcription factor, Y-linked-like [Egretta garzetta]
MSHGNLQLAFGVWQDQAWLARAMVTEESSSPNETGWSQRELSTAAISSSSLDELGESSGLASPASPGWDDQAAVGAIMEEGSFQAWSDDSTTARDTPASSENAGKTEDFSFLKQLWKIACSNKFQSILWVDNGVIVAINEEMFKREMLKLLELFFALFSFLCFYYSPNFKRDHLQLLARCKPRVGCKSRASAAPCLDAELEESHQGLQPV